MKKAVAPVSYIFAAKWLLHALDVFFHIYNIDKCSLLYLQPIYSCGSLLVF